MNIIEARRVARNVDGGQTGSTSIQPETADFLIAFSMKTRIDFRFFRVFITCNSLTVA